MSAGNPLFDAGQALLALAEECIGARCEEYPRRVVDTSVPPHDCSMLAVELGSLVGQSGSCVGRRQMHTQLHVHVVRCCEPVGTLTDAQGFMPPSPEDLAEVVACLTRDAWAIYQCIVCSGCEALNAIPQIEVCCDQNTPPGIRWTYPAGGCRSAIIDVPVVVTACCEEATP